MTERHDPLEALIFGALADVHGDDLIVTGCELRVGEREPAIGTFKDTATAEAFRDLLARALDAADEAAEDERERQSGLVPLGDVLAQISRDEGEPR